MNTRFAAKTLLFGFGLSLAIAGCAGSTSLMPNPDKSLRKNPAQFAADAASRHPYKADAPRGGEADARVQVGYWVNNLDIVNLSQQDWNDVDLWVNQKYVVHIPHMEHGKLKKINFEMLYDDKGNHFPLDNKSAMVNKAELFQDGKMYDVAVRLAD